jgi:type VI secretion system secreted protein VgrG
MSYFTFQSSGLPEGLEVVDFRGEEAIFRLYAFEIHLVGKIEDFASLTLDEAIGARATLGIQPAPDAATNRYHGVLSEVDLLHAAEGRVLVRATLVPALWMLTLARHSRMFTDRAIPDVIREVLQDGGLRSDDFTLQLSGQYEVEEHVCQYKETDFDFFSRWLAREGMYFWFDHEGEREHLIIADDRGYQKPAFADPVRYHPVTGGDVVAGASFRSFHAAHRALPARVAMRDYNHGNPSLDVSGERDVSDAGFEDVVVHGARFFSPDDGARLARIRAEALLAEQRVFEGSGTVYGARAGFTFELEDHPVPGMDRAYLITRVRHEGRQAKLSPAFARLMDGDLAEGYLVTVACIPDDVQFRAVADAPWPRVTGFEAAVIDGPGSGHYALLDDAGRYNVRMRFDESGLKDGRSSTRLRMMQPHAGNPEGFHFPLRDGTEVMVAFLAGDPDRPVIAGAVPDALTPSPVTSANNTKNVIHTGGNSRVEIEDQDGKQHVDISTPPKDTRIHLGEPHEKHTHAIVENTKGDCLFSIGGNQDIDVGGTLTEKVKGAVDETYNTLQLTQIKGPQTTKVTGTVDETYDSSKLTSVQGATLERYQQGHESKVGGLKLEIYASGQNTRVTGTVEEKYTGPHVKIAAATTQTHAGNVKTKVTGAVMQSYGGNVTLRWGATTATYASLLWIIPGGANINAPNWKVNTPEGWWIFDKADFKWAKKLEITGTSRSMTAVKIEVVAGLAAAACGLKDELNDVAIGHEVDGDAVCGFEAELGICYMHAAGIKIFG